MSKARLIPPVGTPGGPKPCDLAIICVFDDASILDQHANEWVRAWETRYKRVKTVKLIDTEVFDDSQTTKTSESFYCEPYSRFSLLIDLGVGGTPTDILIEVKFSDDDAKFYKLMNGPFGDLRWEDSAGDLLEEVQGECRGAYCHLKVTATGTSAANKFTLTGKMVFVT